MAQSGKVLPQTKGVSIAVRGVLRDDLCSIFERLVSDGANRSPIESLLECRNRALNYVRKKATNGVIRAERGDPVVKDMRSILDEEIERALGVIDEKYGGHVSVRVEILDHLLAHKGDNALNDGFLLLASIEVDDKWLIFDDRGADLISTPVAIALEQDFREGTAHLMIALPDSTLGDLVNDSARIFAASEDDGESNPFLAAVLRMIQRDAKVKEWPKLERCQKVGPYSLQLLTDCGLFRVNLRAGKPFLEGNAVREA